MTTNQSAAHPGTPNGTAPRVEIPYFREYLRDVVRPRVEHAVRSIEANLNDNVWRAIVATLAADQQDGVDPAALRALIQDQLGLRIEAKLNAEFTQVLPPQQAASAPAAATGEPAPGDTPEVVTAKRRAMTNNPLAQAVLDNRTRF